MFAELIDIYPMKVTAPDRGVRILHAKDPNSKANKKAKDKYKRITKVKKEKHEHIIKCLKIQLNVVKDLGFMQHLETWLNNHTWEKYEDIDYEDTKSTDPQRITRQL
jgi:adenylate cyclase class IV